MILRKCLIATATVLAAGVAMAAQSAASAPGSQTAHTSATMVAAKAAMKHHLWHRHRQHSATGNSSESEVAETQRLNEQQLHMAQAGGGKAATQAMMTGQMGSASPATGPSGPPLH